MKSINQQPLLGQLKRKFDFMSIVSSGIACHALTYLDKAGILDDMVNTGEFDMQIHGHEEHISNIAAIHTAFLSLQQIEAVTTVGSTYHLTKLGNELVDHIGLISMLFKGYGELMLQRSRAGSNELDDPNRYIDGEAIAKASIQFGENTVDPIIIKILKTLKSEGTLCDLGCGSAARLAKICRICGIPGLGFDSDQKALDYGQQIIKGLPISISLADIASLTNVWKEVDILMQCFG